MLPRIENAPGLTWRPRKHGWEARWHARTDLIKRGYAIKSVRVWTGAAPDATETAYIQNRCQSLQSEMLVWGRGGLPVVAGAFDGTLEGLIRSYQTDKDSGYRGLRYRSKQYYRCLCKKLEETMQNPRIDEVKARQLIGWYEKISVTHLPRAYACAKMLRILINFGATILEDPECERLSAVLSKMRFKMPKARVSFLTAEQAIAIRAEAHKIGRPSVALAQAFQYECLLRQKDVIGEWVPNTEPGISDVLDGQNKWFYGLRWEEVDEDFVLTHDTSKKDKELVVDLKLAAMVMEELAIRLKTAGVHMEEFGPAMRAQFPATGPIIIHEESGLPFTTVTFRDTWRKAANAAGVPRKIWNMDSRAGGITEATDSGSPLEHVKHAATHSDIQMTQRYSRGAAEKIAGVMRRRQEHRANKKPGTSVEH